MTIESSITSHLLPLKLKRQDGRVEAKKAKNAVVEVHETKVRHGELHIENVNDELVTYRCPHGV